VNLKEFEIKLIRICLIYDRSDLNITSDYYIALVKIGPNYMRRGIFYYFDWKENSSKTSSISYFILKSVYLKVNLLFSINLNEIKSSICD
jgi:hypothetical protein